jgi:hypothetical protein
MSQENPISKQPLIRHVNRQQMRRAVDVEHLISEDHPARAIWTLVGRLNLGAFWFVLCDGVRQDQSKCTQTDSGNTDFHAFSPWR